MKVLNWNKSKKYIWNVSMWKNFHAEHGNFPEFKWPTRDMADMPEFPSIQAILKLQRMAAFDQSQAHSI